MGIDITTSIDIERAPADVWPQLVDWENLDTWMKEASDFRVISAHREGPGVEAEATIRIAGIKTRDRIRTVDWEPPYLLSLEHLGWVKGTGTMRMTETGRGTHLEWKEHLEPPWGLLGSIGMSTVKPLIHRIFARDLKLLKNLLEDNGTSGVTTS